MSEDDKSLDSNIEIERQELSGMPDVQDTEEMEVLGHAVMYTVGSDWNVRVPREWLLDRCNDLGIPQWVAPSRPRPSSAYKRTIKQMSEDIYDDSIEIVAPRMDTGVKEPHEVRVEVRDGDETNLKHLYAEVFFDADECKEEGGDWIQHHLGYFDYNVDAQRPETVKDSDLGEDDLLHDVWLEAKDSLYQMFEDMQTTHIGHDIRKMMYYTTRDYTSNVVSLRDGGAVYFFPAAMTDFLDAMSTLYDEIDERFKIGGAEMGVRTIPILDTDEQREWVQARVEKALEESVDKAIETAFEEFDEGETADAVVKVIKEELSDEGDTAEVYNALLETELEIEEILQQKKAELNDDDRKEIVEKAIEQTDIDEF